MTDRLAWGENYSQSLFKVATANLVARKTTTSSHDCAHVWKHDNSWEFLTISELFNELATKKSRWHLLPVVRSRQEGPLTNPTLGK